MEAKFKTGEKVFIPELNDIFEIYEFDGLYPNIEYLVHAGGGARWFKEDMIKKLINNKDVSETAKFKIGDKVFTKKSQMAGIIINYDSISINGKQNYLVECTTTDVPNSIINENDLVYMKFDIGEKVFVNEGLISGIVKECYYMEHCNPYLFYFLDINSPDGKDLVVFEKYLASAKEKENKFKVGDIVHVKDMCKNGKILCIDDNCYLVYMKNIGRYWYTEEELLFVNDDSRIESLKKTPIDPREFGKPDNKTILDEAKEIVDGLRGDDYYDPVKNFRDISVMASLMTGKTITPNDCIKVLISVKLTRESFKHKRDNLVDLCGYTYILDKIEES